MQPRYEHPEENVMSEEKHATKLTTEELERIDGGMRTARIDQVRGRCGTQLDAGEVEPLEEPQGGLRP